MPENQHDDLLRGYLRCGILQFGRFQTPNGDFAPFSLNPLLLPSYPDLLQATAQAIVPLLRAPSRLLALRSTIALGAVVAIQSGVPLVYPHGEASAITYAYVIEGAYDIGHPTTLLADTTAYHPDYPELIRAAKQVGLAVNAGVRLFGWDTPQDNIEWVTLFPMAATLARLAEIGAISPRLYAYASEQMQG